MVELGTFVLQCYCDHPAHEGRGLPVPIEFHAATAAAARRRARADGWVWRRERHPKTQQRLLWCPVCALAAEEQQRALARQRRNG